MRLFNEHIEAYLKPMVAFSSMFFVNEYVRLRAANTMNWRLTALMRSCILIVITKLRRLHTHIRDGLSALNYVNMRTISKQMCLARLETRRLLHIYSIYIDSAA